MDGAQCGLKVLYINNPVFSNCQDLVRVIKQQQESILSLNLVHIVLGAQDSISSWTRNDCRALVTAVSKCKHLVQLNLNQHRLRDSGKKLRALILLPCVNTLVTQHPHLLYFGAVKDIEIMLPCLPNLEMLYLCGPHQEHGYGGEILLTSRVNCYRGLGINFKN